MLACLRFDFLLLWFTRLSPLKSTIIHWLWLSSRWKATGATYGIDWFKFNTASHTHWSTNGMGVINFSHHIGVWLMRLRLLLLWRTLTWWWIFPLSKTISIRNLNSMCLGYLIRLNSLRLNLLLVACHCWNFRVCHTILLFLGCNKVMHVQPIISLRTNLLSLKDKRWLIHDLLVSIAD